MEMEFQKKRKVKHIGGKSFGPVADAHLNAFEEVVDDADVSGVTPHKRLRSDVSCDSGIVHHKHQVARRRENGGQRKQDILLAGSSSGQTSHPIIPFQDILPQSGPVVLDFNAGVVRRDGDQGPIQYTDNIRRINSVTCDVQQRRRIQSRRRETGTHTNMYATRKRGYDQTRPSLYIPGYSDATSDVRTLAGPAFKHHRFTPCNPESSIPAGAVPMIDRYEIPVRPEFFCKRPTATDEAGSSQRAAMPGPTISQPRRPQHQEPEQTNIPRPRRMPPLRTGPPIEYNEFRPCRCVCTACHARFWFEERLSTSTRRSGPLYHRCCMGGRVRLFIPRDYPNYIRQLFSDQHFLNNIRAYNQMFAMTSLGVNIDESVNTGSGPYIFKVSGHVYHRIGRMCPEPGQTPRPYDYRCRHSSVNCSNFLPAAPCRADHKQVVYGTMLPTDLQQPAGNKFDNGAAESCYGREKGQEACGGSPCL